MLPAGPLLCKLVESACKKFPRVAELLLSPRALIMFWKLVSSDESVVLVEPVELVALVELASVDDESVDDDELELEEEEASC